MGGRTRYARGSGSAWLAAPLPGGYPWGPFRWNCLALRHWRDLATAAEAQRHITSRCYAPLAGGAAIATPSGHLYQKGETPCRKLPALAACRIMRRFLARRLARP